MTRGGAPRGAAASARESQGAGAAASGRAARDAGASACRAGEKPFKAADLWPLWLIGLFFVLAALVYLLTGENARIAVADNLDLFQAQYQMMKNTGTFFARDAQVPMLHGVTRDDLPGDWQLTGLLYAFLPSFTAYIVLYFIKIAIAVTSFCLLAIKLWQDGVLDGVRPRAAHGAAIGAAGTATTSAADARPAAAPTGAVPAAEASSAAGPAAAPDKAAAKKQLTACVNLSLLCGFAYGALCLFPAFGISFASIPLLIWLVLRFHREQKKSRAALYLVGIFAYPFLSYFSYFGLFLIAYLCVAWIWSSAAEKRLNHRLFFSIIALSAGYAFFENRLFASMLFSKEATIRQTMKIASMTWPQILDQMKQCFLTGGAMHVTSVHAKLVLPVCCAYFIILNAGCILRKDYHRIFHDVFNLGALILVFNCFVFGIYYSEGVRNLISRLIPPLTGWQFGRTNFFNPFLWYGLFCIALYRLYLWTARRGSEGQTKALKGRGGRVCCSRLFRSVSYLPAVLSVLIVLLTPVPYNDLYHTVHAQLNAKLRGVNEQSLSYSEFYSEDLFEKIKRETGYHGEWSAAYGLHPATLEYNGIATLDGYLGFYSQDYKDRFRKIIAPALDKQPASRAYFDDWGARCYLYSGSSMVTVEAVRTPERTKEPLDMDVAAFKALGGKYIFSRLELTNAEEKGLSLRGKYSMEDASPYTIYVYEAR